MILKSEHLVSKIPVSGKLWIDIAIEDLDDAPKVMKCRPCCNYHGRIVPCFYCTASKASITSTLLADILMNKCGILYCSIAKPILLLDGHGNRMIPPFPKCTIDPEHE